MDFSTAKRRRTSLSGSIEVTRENTDLRQSAVNGISPSKRRSSLMSPTKASLARFYPSLLPRAKSAEPPRPGTKEHTSIIERSATAGGSNGIVAHVAGTASEGSELKTNGVGRGLGMAVTSERRSQTPGEGNTLAKQGQSVVNPGPRASPPEEVRDEGTVISDTNGKLQGSIADAADIESTGVTYVPDSQNAQIPSTPTQREPLVPTSGMGVGEDGEPSLPSTPSQLDLEPPRERPKGLLLSSPSRRLRRTGRSSAKSSPLKPPAVPPEHPDQKPMSQLASLGPRRHIAKTPKLPLPPEEIQLQQMRDRLNDLEKQLRDIEDKILRQLLVSSWHQDRGKELKDTAKQKKDVVQRSTKIVQLRHEVLEVQAAQSIHHREAEPEGFERKVASTKAPTLTQRLANILPFSMKPRPLEPKPPLPETMDMNEILHLGSLQTTAEPFTITTSDTLLLPTAADNNLLQRQLVTMSTSHQLLTCNFQVTANIASQQISHFDLQELSPWAEPELGSWLRQSYKTMEPAALGRAFGHYWEVARLRGNCWISCKQEFKDLVANVPESNSPFFFLGLQDLVFARSNVQLKVDWRISLSDQGEVESHSSAYPRFPPAWQQDANSELARIGDAFTMLVEDRGITEAIGMICKVVFPT